MRRGVPAIHTRSSAPGGRQPDFASGPRLLALLVAGLLGGAQARAQAPFRVKDIAPGPAGSDIGAFVEYGGRLLFFHRDTSSTNAGLWSSDGSDAGTVQLSPARLLEVPWHDPSTAGLGGLLYFVSPAFPPPSPGPGRLWRTDGTAAGTIQALDLALDPDGRLGAASGRLFFGAIPAGPNPGSELYSSDGTLAGTSQLTFGNDPMTFGPTSLTPATGRLFFVHPGDAAAGPELWASGGDAAGTSRLSDACPGACAGLSFSHREVFTTGQTAWFGGRDAGGDIELWTSDGTVAGTSRVADICPGACSSYPGWRAGGQVGSFAALGGQLLFTVTMDGLEPSELWRSDGTAAGTALVVPAINPILNDSAELAGSLLFNGAGAPADYELWRTDGTTAGTALVKDIFPGAAGSYPRGLVGAAGRIYFAANDGTSGEELWQSDGSDSGTVQVADLRPGPFGSSPRDLTVAGDYLFFSADDGTAGRELWALKLPSVARDLLRDSSITVLSPPTPALSTILPLTRARHLYQAAFASGSTDPDLAILTGVTPLAFYALDGAGTVKLSKSAGRIRIDF